MTDGLFDVGPDAYLIPPAPEQLTRGERRQRLVAKRIATGEHPLGKGLRLHLDAATERDGEGLRCGDCRFRVLVHYHDRTWPKCRFPTPSTTSPTGVYYHRDTNCESSDVRAWWPACVDYQPEEKT